MRGNAPSILGIPVNLLTLVKSRGLQGELRLINLIDFTYVHHVYHDECLSCRDLTDLTDMKDLTDVYKSLSSNRLNWRLRSRSFILSRFSKAFLPLASQNSTLIWLPRVYMDTGMHVKPFSANLPAR